MTDTEKQLLTSILTTLNKVSYTALIEIKKLNEASEKDIELLESHRLDIEKLINQFGEE